MVRGDNHGSEIQPQNKEAQIKELQWNKLGSKLESTDAAGRVAHPSPTRRNAGRGVRRGWPWVRPRLSFFFSDSSRIGWIRADAARFAPNRLRLASNRADSARIGLYRPATDTADTAETGRKRPKLALKLAGAVEILTSDVFFAFFFLCFMNQVY